MFRAIAISLLLLQAVAAQGANHLTSIKNVIEQDTCSGISPLPCNAIKVDLPFHLSFDAPVANSVNDKNGQGTGFRTINNYSGTRTTQDGVPSNMAIKGYEASKILVTGGKLQLTANKGIDYQTNNNQLNVLGIQLAPANKLVLEVKVIAPFNGTQSQQAGLWYGLNDKTFIKLSITGNKVELRKETADVSSGAAGLTNPDQRITSVISGLQTKTVTLKLIIDTQTLTAEGFYAIDGGAFVNTGNGYAAPSLNLTGMGITSGNVFAGIYCSYRNGTTAVNYTFDDFDVSSISPQPFSGCPMISTLPCTALKVNMPFSLNFDQPVDNTITDNSGKGTGFTTVNNYSGTRLAQDGQPAIIEVPGYLPSSVNLSTGRLQLTANKGIDYQANNNQLNVLGVQANAGGKVQIDVKLINPYNGAQSQQAGIWYGLSDKTYIKLGITGNKIELRKELNDVSSGASGSSNPDQRITPAISGLNTKTVTLRLLIDSAAQTAEGFYSTDGVTFKSAGASGYSQPSLNISAMGISSGQVYTGIFATYRNGTTPVNYLFDDFGISRLSSGTTGNTISFAKDSLDFTFLKNGQLIPQSVGIVSNPPVNGITLSKINADWLTLPTITNGSLQFTGQSISSAISAGKYKGLVVASAPGYAPDTLLVKLTVVNGVSSEAININFQDAATVPPTGYSRDYGQPYGERTGINQQATLTYGWRKRSDGSAFSLVGNGRNRNTPEDIVLATIFHMQANNISGTFTGVKTEGYWELKVPNGSYDVTATVGDGLVNAAPESHSLNIEGVAAITNFVPNGKKGDIGRFKTKTVRVRVADEKLTITADGGTNTKIAGASIVPDVVDPYLYWAESNNNIVIGKGANTPATLVTTLGSSNNLAANYQLSVAYTGTAQGWLNFTPTASGVQPAVALNYSAAKSLPVGKYNAKVTATATGFSASVMNFQVSVVDTLSPYVISSTPADGATNVSTSTVSIAANNLHVPAVPGYQGGVNNKTIKDSTVKLFRVTDGQLTQVAGTVQGTGGGDAISFSPSNMLEPNAVYRFVITAGVKSYSGASFAPYEATFTTDERLTDTANRLNAQFTKVAIPGTQNIKYSSLIIGPDGKFYALRLNGSIERYDINHATGMLTNKKTISTLISKYGERTAIGIAFDPTSTAQHPILWVSHSSAGLTAAPAFDGNISRLRGDSLQIEELVITKLPRSTRDHMVNSLAFGPDNALYISQGSNSSAGDYDNDWQRNESLLAGAILRLDIAKLNGITLPLNVQTTTKQTVINNAPAVSRTMSDGTYNPYGSQSPLTIYASGVRNAYDLLWHSNGQLYVPANGSGGGGNSPASVAGTRRPDGTFYSGPAVVATTGVPVQVDWLFRVNPAKPVGYYGHPNPLRGEYVINRGFADNPLYSPAVSADSRYRQGYNFGLNHSPNGVIEYKSDTFNGILKGKLLVCRFSGGGDIEVMEPGSKVKVDSAAQNDKIYDIIKVTTGSGYNGLVGMSGFANPLDIVEDVTNGNLYVAELNWNDNPNLTAQITLLQVQGTPVAPAPMLAVSAEQEPGNQADNKNYSITLANKGEGVLKVKSIALSGKDKGLFKIGQMEMPAEQHPLSLQKNSALNFNVSAKRSSQKRIARLVVTDIEGNSKEVELGLDPAQDSLKADSSKVTFEKANVLSIDKRQLIVYPNPNPGRVVYTQLRNFRRGEAVTLGLFDMMGNRLSTQKITMDESGQFNTQFNINSSDTNHFYIIRAVFPSGAKYAKIIVN